MRNSISALGWLVFLLLSAELNALATCPAGYPIVLPCPSFNFRSKMIEAVPSPWTNNNSDGTVHNLAQGRPFKKGPFAAGSSLFCSYDSQSLNFGAVQTQSPAKSSCVGADNEFCCKCLLGSLPGADGKTCVAAIPAGAATQDKTAPGAGVLKPAVPGAVIPPRTGTTPAP